MAGPMRLAEHRVKWWKGVLYGPPGIGKTVLCSTSQKYRTFVFDCDDGMASARAFVVKHNLKDDLVTFWPVKSYDDFIQGYKWLCAHGREFDLVVVDSMTELQKIVKRGVADKTKHETTDQRDWGVILDVMDLATAEFKGKPWHVIIVCHETLKLDAVIGAEQFRPSFQGTYKYEYARHFSFIIRYTMWWSNEIVRDTDGKQKASKKLQRWLDCGPNPAIHYKDRSGALSRWETPDIDKLLDKMIASQGEGGGEVEECEQPADPSETAATERLESMVAEQT